MLSSIHLTICLTYPGLDSPERKFFTPRMPFWIYLTSHLVYPSAWHFSKPMYARWPKCDRLYILVAINRLCLFKSLIPYCILCIPLFLKSVTTFDFYFLTMWGKSAVLAVWNFSVPQLLFSIVLSCLMLLKIASFFQIISTNLLWLPSVSSFTCVWNAWRRWDLQLPYCIEHLCGILIDWWFVTCQVSCLSGIQKHNCALNTCTNIWLVFIGHLLSEWIVEDEADSKQDTWNKGWQRIGCHQNCLWKMNWTATTMHGIPIVYFGLISSFTYLSVWIACSGWHYSCGFLIFW